jgi:hypothetical protein
MRGRGNRRVKRQFFPDSDESEEDPFQESWGVAPEKYGRMKELEQQGKRARKKSAKLAEALEDEQSLEEGQAGNVAPAKTGRETVAMDVDRICIVREKMTCWALSGCLQGAMSSSTRVPKKSKKVLDEDSSSEEDKKETSLRHTGRDVSLKIDIPSFKACSTADGVSEEELSALMDGMWLHRSSH